MASSQPDLQFQNEFKHSLLFFSNAVNETQLPGLLPPWPPARINEHKGRKGVFQMKERGWTLPDWGGKQITSQSNSFPQTFLWLFTAAWPKRKQVNLMKNDWGVLVLVVLDVRLWVGFHHAVYSSGENANRIWLSTTCSLFFSQWMGPESCKHISHCCIYVYKVHC